MRQLTIMVIPDGAHSVRQIKLPSYTVKLAVVAALGFFCLLGFFVFDYMDLHGIRSSFQQVSTENEGLKGEARILMTNLEEVKRSLRKVQDYTAKLGDLTKLRVQKVAKKTGIGPLSKEEYKTSQANEPDLMKSKDYFPLGVNLDNLIFRPVFDRLSSIGARADAHALELQQLLSTLSQQKSMLASIPSISPVSGWITSGYGIRISPFTGERTMHRGIDIAAPLGTPIIAPADGVVIFTGAKAGFGNFIMIAHGYGVVSRYGHNHQNMVQPGQKIRRGEQIATVGRTGRTTGAHLHYEILVNGRSNNPRKFILDFDSADIGYAH